MTQDSTGTATSRWWLWGCSGQVTPRDLRNLRRVNYALFGWMFVFVASAFVIRGPGQSSLAIAATVMAACALAFVPVLLAYRRFLREADELTRLIQIRAMAAAFGAGVFMSFLEKFVDQVVSFLPASPIFINANDIFNPLMAMVVTYTVTVIAGQRRYR